MSKNLYQHIRAYWGNVIPVSGWDTRTNIDKPFNPKGIVIHWDALRTFPPVAYYLKTNRFGAPIYNIVINPEGAAYLLSQGIVWHAGKGDPLVLTDLQQGSANRDGTVSVVSGNSHLVGVALNFHPEYSLPLLPTDDQLQALYGVLAGCCEHWGLTPEQIIDHRRWSPRKPDIRSNKLPDLDDIRAKVRSLLRGAAKGFGDMGIFVLKDDPETREKAWAVEFWKRQLLRIDPTLPFGPDNGDDWGTFSDAFSEAIRAHAVPATGVGIGPGEADRIMAKVREIENTLVATEIYEMSVEVQDLKSTIERMKEGLLDAGSA